VSLNWQPSRRGYMGEPASAVGTVVVRDSVIINAVILRGNDFPPKRNQLATNTRG
jgi:hypothetical protein